jgi:cytoskeleton protein RodZ
MAGFGENLRREREMRRISLEEISETTKISVRFLEALENEEFASLPGGIFIRSFIRTYSNYLGLDAESVMAEYQLVAPAQDEEDFSRLCVSSGVGPRHKKRPPVLPWVFAIILLGGGYGIFRYAHRSAEAPLSFAHPALEAQAATSGAADRTQHASSPAGAPGQTAGQTAAPVSKAPVTDSTASAKSGSHSPNLATSPRATSSRVPKGGNTAAISAVGEDGLQRLGGGAVGDPVQSANSLAPRMGSTSQAAAENRGELVLQVAANQPSWVAVEADGKTVLEHVLGPDNVRTLIAKNYFDVTTGNAQGTVLTLNGVTLKPLGRRGEVRRLHLTRDDLKKLTP